MPLLDYRWWWRSFLSSGACAGYTLLYAIWYNLTELDMDGLVPVLLYSVRCISHVLCMSSDMFQNRHIVSITSYQQVYMISTDCFPPSLPFNHSPT